MKRFTIFAAAVLSSTPAMAQNFVTHQSAQTDALGNPSGGLASMLGNTPAQSRTNSNQPAPQARSLEDVYALYPNLAKPDAQPQQAELSAFAPGQPVAAEAYPRYEPYSQDSAGSYPRQYEPQPPIMAAQQSPEFYPPTTLSSPTSEFAPYEPNGGQALPMSAARDPEPRYQPYSADHGIAYPRQYETQPPAMAVQQFPEITAPTVLSSPAPQLVAPYESNGWQTQPVSAARDPEPNYQPYSPDHVDTYPRQYASPVPQPMPAPIPSGYEYGQDQQPGNYLTDALSPPAYEAAMPSMYEMQQPTVAYNEPQMAAPPIADEPSFQEESETSRKLLAMEDQYNAAVKELEARKQARKAALLDQFEKDAADPDKVIGLADRLRKAIAALDEVHQVALADEEKRYNTARLDLLSASPSRVD